MQVKLRKHTIDKQILENKQIVTREYYSDANQYIPASAGLDYSIVALEDKQIIAHRDIDINVYKETMPIGIVNSFKAFFEHFGSERVASTLVKRGGEKRIIYRHGNLYSHDIAKNTVTVLASIVVADSSVFEIKLQEGKTLFESSLDQKFTPETFQTKVLDQNNIKLLVDVEFSTNSDYTNLYTNFKTVVEAAFLEKGLEVVYLKSVQEACFQEEVFFDRSKFKTASQIIKFLRQDLPQEISDFERVREEPKEEAVKEAPVPRRAEPTPPPPPPEPTPEPDRALSEEEMRSVEQYATAAEPAEWNPWDDPEYSLDF